MAIRIIEYSLLKLLNFQRVSHSEIVMWNEDAIKRSKAENNNHFWNYLGIKVESLKEVIWWEMAAHSKGAKRVWTFREHSTYISRPLRCESGLSRNMFECKLTKSALFFYFSFFFKTRIGFYWGLSRRESRCDRDLKGSAFGCGWALKCQHFPRNYSTITIFVVTLLLLFFFPFEV